MDFPTVPETWQAQILLYQFSLILATLCIHTDGHIYVPTNSAKELHHGKKFFVVKWLKFSSSLDEIWTCENYHHLKYTTNGDKYTHNVFWMLHHPKSLDDSWAFFILPKLQQAGIILFFFVQLPILDSSMKSKGPELKPTLQYFLVTNPSHWILGPVYIGNP